MKAIDLLRMGLEMTRDGVNEIMKGLESAPLTQPTSAGGNHPLWLIGHLAYVEGAFHTVLFGTPNPVAEWGSIFGTGSTPQTDAAIYPPFDQVLSRFNALRAETMRLLESVGDAGLDAPPHTVPPGFEDSMHSMGQSFLLLCLHHMVHYGQAADARRVAGLKPLL